MSACVFQKAEAGDLPAVASLYRAVCEQVEGQNPNPCGWRADFYPTAQDAEAAFAKGTLYVLEDAGDVIASAILNGEQPEAYGEVLWEPGIPEDQVMVVHTFMVHPKASGKGYGRALLEAGHRMARVQGIRAVRLDTTEINLPAQRLYHSLGYRLQGVVDLRLAIAGYRWYHCYEYIL